MKNIVIGYHFLGIIPRAIMTTHPDKWEELTAKQLIATGRLMTNSIKEDEYLSVMLNVPVRVVKKLDDWQRYNLGVILHFLRVTTPHNRFIIPQLCEYYSPDENFSDISFEDFIFADTFFADYTETGDKEKLYLFVAALYRERDENGKRKHWDEDIAEQWAMQLKRHGDATLEAIAANYGLVRQWLQKAYPNVFPSGETDGTAKKKSKKQSGGWLEVLDSLVGDDIVNQPKYLHMKAMNTLRFMERKIKENKKKNR